ncbi:hypothetical protein K438DRAFT_1856590 [Mycena galopus ATCC 62051]|nr:hypothetical protein K438DRAFT_1856590 [Mycena galopus ATCC 62051]
MHVALLPSIALSLLLLRPVYAQNGSSIPGLTEGQQECLANCLFFGIPAAANCPQDSADPDVACFCGSQSFVANVTQCASSGCNICTTGGCNITANPLTDACGSDGTGTVSASNSESTSATASASVSSSVAPGSPSGSGPLPSGSGAPNSARYPFEFVQTATALSIALVFVALMM